MNRDAPQSRAAETPDAIPPEAGAAAARRRFDFEPWRFFYDPDEAIVARQTAWRAELTRAYGCSFGDPCYVAETAAICTDRLVMGNRTWLAHDTHIGGDVEMGDHCSVNVGAEIRGRVRLGEGVRIGSNAKLIAFNHRFDDPETPIHRQGAERLGITVGDDVWIGAGAIVLDGVEIASHSVIAAGAIVTKNVADYAIVGGNPARFIRDRRRRPGAEASRGAPERSIRGFGESAREQWRSIVQRHRVNDADRPAFADAPGGAPSLRAVCDAVEIAAMFDAAPPGCEPARLVDFLRSTQSPRTGLPLSPWPGPDGTVAGDDLDDRAAAYGVLSVGYALRCLDAAFAAPISAAEALDGGVLCDRLARLPWGDNAWGAGAWIDHYATAVWFNLRNFARGPGPETLLGWLLCRADPDTGVWGRPTRGGGFLLPINGYYRLTRGSFAQFDAPVPYPERTIDTVLAHTHRYREFERGEHFTACNVLDVLHPLWLCGRQTGHRRAEVEALARRLLPRVLERWVEGEGFAFSPRREPGLQGTEMWLSIVYTIADLLDLRDACGYHPRGVHRLAESASPRGPRLDEAPHR